ncbi:uncharacterized protein LOC105695471 isoform X2 [Orussus abietinus]|uniref:uncharacterized protein LOC105695471 isoform X2 n=1 Tax=Orussus abietinus TaxID=222816 RepID=UPI0006265E7B|nr:uncharacterized protein LOC105695471 isoform X2 [Orussus abietinus]
MNSTATCFSDCEETSERGNGGNSRPGNGEVQEEEFHTTGGISMTKGFWKSRKRWKRRSRSHPAEGRGMYGNCLTGQRAMG